MPLMKHLTYLKLDTCEIDNELLYEFRKEVQDQCKVVWRVFFGQNNALTDTYKIWATWNVDTKEVAVLKYCNEVKYLDLGHNSFMNLDFTICDGFSSPPIRIKGRLLQQTSVISSCISSSMSMR